MWNNNKSLFLSRVLTITAAGVAIFVAFFIPTIAEWYQYMMTVEAAGILDRETMYVPMCITLYVCDALALGALWNLHVLLGNISRDEVFIPKNTSCLRRISWLCMGAGSVCIIFGLWSSIFAFVGMVAIMFGLIMRVLKNVFEKAVEIKSENDFTI
ncbi:DUF2975 domain-containing protein [Ruminococcus flavefaciens]|uniref:DUF2975 family protein n=1 Tax=Ruminococcus flavefaciens TaxID=1265 RepID=A0A1M7MIF8_RUMFL|nr:DUF2975 domain-containing protein [Ruminococcus flavefaciens]SHM90752.1 Protein of unknown function [Ruminococcus flavefaciens]